MEESEGSMFLQINEVEREREEIACPPDTLEMVSIIKCTHHQFKSSFNCIVFSDDQCTVRVTNLSEDAQEADLRELFSHFGNIRRIFLAKDKQTQQSKVYTKCTVHRQLSV